MVAYRVTQGCDLPYFAENPIAELPFVPDRSPAQEVQIPIDMVRHAQLEAFLRNFNAEAQ